MSTTQKVKATTKQTAKQAAQMLADTVKQETLETLKTGKGQVTGREKIVDRGQDPGIVGYLREQTDQNADADVVREEIRRKEQQSLRMWQNKLEEIKYEERKAREQIKQERERVEQIQEERMKELTPEHSPAPVEIVGSSKKRRGPLGKVRSAVSGFKNAIEQKMRKRETGRGAKG